MADVEVVPETCREWVGTNRCNERAEFILWGKLFAPDAFGPRCAKHAVKHTDHDMPYRPLGWAVFDLRPLNAVVERQDNGDALALTQAAAATGFERGWETCAAAHGLPAGRSPLKGDA